MNALYPLTFSPIFKEKIWGGNRIKTFLNMDFSPLPNCGELWALSGVPEENSIVANGFLAGNELNELLEVYMDDLVGSKVYETFGNVFPILVKIIDSNDWLSVQVHPDDETASRFGFPNGKTEMWYVLQADENATLISGFKKNTNAEEFLQKLKEKKLSDLLNYISVHQGDVFYTPGKRIHALGPGILLAEIQQTSDITWRVYDWDRTTENGQSRPLHLEQALQSMDFQAVKDVKTEYNLIPDKTNPVIKSPYFTTGIIQTTKPFAKDLGGLDSFVIYLCLEGSVEIFANEKLVITSGNCALIPAEINEVSFIPRPSVKLFEIYMS